MSTCMHAYLQKKEKLIAALRNDAFSDHGSVSLCPKKTSNLFRPRQAPRQGLDLRHFNELISIDTVAKSADVEGLITYEAFVQKTLSQNLLPAVVPELKSITVGGAIAGCGIEASSFRYGLVHETVLEMDILLSDGRVLLCTPFNENKELFFAFPNTFGTLGYLLRAKLRLVIAKKFVKLTHTRFRESSFYFQQLASLCQTNSAKDCFIEGVIFNPTEMVLSQGAFVDAVPYLSSYTYRHIYYRSLLQKTEDFLTTEEYIWRWDTDWFWCSKKFLMENPLLRILFGKWCLGSKTYGQIMHFFGRHALLSHMYEHWLGKEESIIQDVLIPLEHGHSFLRFLSKAIAIYPIWLCPIYSNGSFTYPFCPLEQKKLYIDFGFWGAHKSSHPPGYYNRQIEETVRGFFGFKSLYSHSYYTEDEFWSIYDRAFYLHLKNKYDSANMFGDLYRKCCAAP